MGLFIICSWGSILLIKFIVRVFMGTVILFVKLFTLFIKGSLWFGGILLKGVIGFLVFLAVLAKEGWKLIQGWMEAADHPHVIE